MTGFDDDEARSRERDRSRDFDGFRIDLPFFALRMGSSAWGFGMSNDNDEYRRARSRVRARLGFYRHLMVFAAILGSIAFLDLVTGGGISGPVLWIAGIWGALLVWQAFTVFVFPSIWSRETEERMIEEELRKQRNGSS